MSFWENVENVREFKNLTRKELAYKANFSLNSISTGIARNSIPAADVACRIAKVLGVSVEYLVTGEGRFLSEKNKEVTEAENKIEESISYKREKLLKTLEKHTALINDFSELASDTQKTLCELIHKIARDKMG